MTHPLALTGHVNGFGNVRAGDRIYHELSHRSGILDEALSDGTAFVTWDDGSFGEVKWNHLRSEA